MDYGDILSRAWRITWRWKVLWILGFLAALGKGGGGGGNYASSAGPGGEGLLGRDIAPEVAGIIGSLLCWLLVIGVVVGIIIWVVSVIARGGLIAGVQQVEEEGATSFGQAWRVGASRFWTLFGIGVLAAIPIILAVLAGVAVALMLAVGAGITAEAARPAAAAGLFLVPALLCGIPFICLVVIGGILLRQIRIYAERAAVLEGLGWIDAFARGWEVLRANVGPTVLLWLIFAVLGMLIGAVVAAGALAFAAPLVLSLLAALSILGDPQAWMLLPVGIGVLLAIILGSAIGSVLTTFTSATWTLAYRQMTGLAAEPAASSAES